MHTFPSGFWFVFLCLLLLAVSSLPSYGQDLRIPENEWQNFKASYRQLEAHSSELQANLLQSVQTSRELERQLARAWLDLNRGKNLLLISQTNLSKVQGQLQSSIEQLKISESGLKELKGSIRSQKGRAYLIGGAVGLGVGILAGILIGVNMGG